MSCTTADADCTSASSANSTAELDKRTTRSDEDDLGRGGHEEIPAARLPERHAHLGGTEPVPVRLDHGGGRTRRGGALKDPVIGRQRTEIDAQPRTQRNELI